MLKAVFLTVSVILIVTVKVNTLQCYVCYDCLQVKDEYLTSCDSLVSTTTPASTTTTTTTVSSTSSTSTIAPGTSTTTTVAPETSNNTTTTTAVPETSTDTTTTTTTTTTTVPPEANTTTTTTTTTLPLEANTTTTTTTTTTTQPETKTSAHTYVEESTNKLLAADTSLRRVKRADITYECFQGKIHVNNTDVIVRGCAAGRTNQTCEQFGLTGCSFCDTDKCNGAWTTQPSVIVLIATFFLLPVIKE